MSYCYTPDPNCFPKICNLCQDQGELAAASKLIFLPANCLPPPSVLARRKKAISNKFYISLILFIGLARYIWHSTLLMKHDFIEIWNKAYR